MPTLEDGREAINHGNLQQARLIFEAILQENPRSEDAWLGLAEVLPETSDKRICYENVLKIDKENVAAREGLRNLEPQADPLVDALKPKTPAPTQDFAETDDEDEIEHDEIPADIAPRESESETPTFVLVAVGLALSVVVFAIGGGLVFYLLSSLGGG